MFAQTFHIYIIFYFIVHLKKRKKTQDNDSMCMLILLIY